MSFETHVFPEIDNKNPLRELEGKIIQNIEGSKNILIEGIPQMAAICERHQLAMQMFCESPQGFGKIVKTRGLQTSKLPNNNIS